MEHMYGGTLSRTEHWTEHNIYWKCQQSCSSFSIISLKFNLISCFLLFDQFLNSSKCVMWMQFQCNDFCFRRHQWRQCNFKTVTVLLTCHKFNCMYPHSLGYNHLWLMHTYLQSTVHYCGLSGWLVSAGIVEGFAQGLPHNEQYKRMWLQASQSEERTCQD